jgi:hypothetical protein
MKFVKRNTCVKDSEVHGKGIFATCDIPVGKIAWYRGPIYSELYLSTTARSNTFFMAFPGHKIIDGAEGNHWTKYINDPRGTEKAFNLEFGQNASVHSTRIIRAGEELLVEYGDDYWDNMTP